MIALLSKKCDYNGNFFSEINYKLIFKTNIEFNHSHAWQTLDKKITGEKKI